MVHWPSARYIQDMTMDLQAARAAEAERSAQKWTESVYCCYEKLLELFPADPEQGLGGRLIFAGELQPESSAADARVTAANIAGAATLVAAPDALAQRRAMRDALADFVVNTVEEALRILKNEVRQRRAVSVAVAVSAEYLMEEMVRRGVQPDALPAQDSTPANSSTRSVFLRKGARLLDLAEASRFHFVCWRQEKCCGSRSTPEETAAREIAIDGSRQRWLRLAPRYLGRAAQRWMGVGIRGEEQMAWMDALRRASALMGGEGLKAHVEVIQT